SLELYTGFYTAINSKPNFFPRNLQIQPATRAFAPTTTQTSTTPAICSNCLSSEALDYSTVLHVLERCLHEFCPEPERT
ncbi:hypothetical protein, partial [Acidovorax sp. sic0104]|uniref:hypothetical protein n=1 Tax=Acidovorax sp. sic0104 TaxID=2854784 RepID=UPI001C489E83